MIFTSVIMKCGKPGINGRVFTKESVEEALAKYKYVQNPNKVSLRMVSYWWEGDTLYGKFEAPDFAKE